MIFEAEEIKKVVLGLLGGSIYPVGDSSYDADVKERVELLKGVLEELHDIMYDLSKKCEFNKNLASIKEVGDVVEKYFDYVKENGSYRGD